MYVVVWHRIGFMPSFPIQLWGTNRTKAKNRFGPFLAATDKMTRKNTEDVRMKKSALRSRENVIR